jgi:secondary thiamine-phosphate synthase enzyme
VDTETFTVETGKRRVIDISEHVARFCSGRGEGLCSVFVPHATAGVGLMEVGSGSERDLESVLDRLFPREDVYAHRHGSKGHGADHLIPVFVSPSLVLPVVDGRPALGTWQSVVLIDPNTDNPRRQVRLSFVSG